TGAGRLQNDFRRAKRFAPDYGHHAGESRTLGHLGRHRNRPCGCSPRNRRDGDGRSGKVEEKPVSRPEPNDLLASAGVTLLRDSIQERTGLDFEGDKMDTLLEKLSPLMVERELTALDYYYL